MIRITIVVLAGLLSACAVEYDVVGRFDSYNEVFRGRVEYVMFGGAGADVTLSGENSGVVCRGDTEVTHIPPLSVGCAGQRGIVRLICSDGRTASGRWRGSSCTSGDGWGVDSDGNSFSFVFGSTGEESEARLAELRSQSEGLPNPPVYRPREVRQERGYSTGSGFFVTADGHLITNYHVVESAESITVVLSDGREVAATIVATDADNDVALLDTDVLSMPLPFSGSGEPMRGDEVLTLGYPLVTIQGQEQRANFGRVNALTGVGGDPRFLQIDVPIQPGNSGGPLLDASGRVVGVVTATLNQLLTLRESGALPQNVNYAVKSEFVAPLLGQIPSATTGGGGQRSSMADIAARAEPSVVLVIAR